MRYMQMGFISCTDSSKISSFFFFFFFFFFLLKNKSKTKQLDVFVLSCRFQGWGLVVWGLQEFSMKIPSLKRLSYQS
jgi:hypothetical protein